MGSVYDVLLERGFIEQAADAELISDLLVYLPDLGAVLRNALPADYIFF